MNVANNLHGSTMTMADALPRAGDEDEGGFEVMNKLMELASTSEEHAYKLSTQLIQSLKPKPPSAPSPNPRRRAVVRTEESKDDPIYFPIPMPTLLFNPKKNADDSIFTVPMACAESIQHSLGKIAVTGSKASSELRSLEQERQAVDQQAMDLAAALTLRQLAQTMVDTFNHGKLRDCVHAIAHYRTVNPSPQALALVGVHAIDTYTDMETKLTLELLRRYEAAVRSADVHGLSELTPLLGLLSLAHKGVGLYLEYTSATLEKIVRDATYTSPSAAQPLRERGQYPSQNTLPQEPPKPNVPLQLAKMYNGAVTHLRHHLPMVVSALGEANGDVEMIRLVARSIGENHATNLLQRFCQDQQLARTNVKAELVANAILDRYVGSANTPPMDYLQDVLANPSLAIAVVTGGVLSDEYHQVSTIANDSKLDDPELQEDCGFHSTLGTLTALDAFMEDCALCLQHTESYERFLKHAADEVARAREYRRQQSQKSDNNPQSTTKHDPILPPTSKLDEICSELGGHYSGIEHCLLLASMQRAFAKAFHTTRPAQVERLFSPVAILQTDAPSNALQTSLVEECFYAAQRSTLRAFATGHAGTACAAANFCTDSIGRALLQVVIRKTELSVVALRPGEGLLIGQGGLSQTAMNALRTVTQRSNKPKKTTDLANAAMEQLMQYRVRMGIARACASFNDVEVAAVSCYTH